MYQIFTYIKSTINILLIYEQINEFSDQVEFKLKFRNFLKSDYDPTYGHIYQNLS